ncbi:winged helix-turn-helix domain-containing protein [Halosimplex halophilum]|uniref:winged helix-turn-helix domain-containing protein n=1 Tax=Halosimplex halophilum TaxID=2559572 RepID=UPI00107EF163|nr:helix-turn-helix domain-containing protein [Halosimplex halophilum]
MGATRDRAFLDAVGDEDCTTILDAVREEARTIPELSEECDIPLSTAYRKVNRLQEADLVAEKNRLPEDCRPKNVYELNFDGAVVRMGEEGFAVEFVDESPDPTTPVSPGDRPPSPVGSD